MKFKNLNRYRIGGTKADMQLSVPIPTTPDGRVYRYSPNADAHPRHFVLGPFDPAWVNTDVHRARMKLAPRSSQTVCPYSGIVAPDAEFIHPDDIQAARDVVADAAMRDIEDALRKAFSGLNKRSSSRGLVRVETTFTPGARRPKPRFARRDLLRELVCDHCSRDYGVFALSLFCPDCGAPNLGLHFAREVALVREQVALATENSAAAPELAYRLLGNAHEDVLTAFETTQKAVYLYGVAQAGIARAKPVKNDFQNTERAQARFAELGLDPFACLHGDALDALKLNIQKRHIIGHNLGVMDEKFASLADNARVGETVRLVATDVIGFAELCQQVVVGLDAWLAGVHPAALVDGSTIKTEATDVAAATEKTTAKLPQRIAVWIAKRSEDGFPDPVSGQDIASAFANEDADAIAEAIAELEADGYVTTAHYLNGPPHVRPMLDLFASFDKEAIGSEPVADAAELIPMILKGEDQVDVPALHTQTGWSLRRFNPAIGLVLANIDNERVSQEISSDYPSRWFMMLPLDRVELKRYLTRIGGVA